MENNKISTYVTFYNFGHTGQNQVDNVVSTYGYGDILIPDIEYLDEKYAVAFSEKEVGIDIESMEKCCNIYNIPMSNMYIQLHHRTTREYIDNIKEKYIQ